MKCVDLFLLLVGAVGLIGGVTVSSRPSPVFDTPPFLYPVWFWWEDLHARGKVPTWIAKPLLLCPTCMSSVWGSLVYLGIGFLLEPTAWRTALFWGWWPIHVCATAFGVHLLLNLNSALLTLLADGHPRPDRQQHP